MGRAEQIAIALDQQVNALLGGWADETFSARCYRNAKRDGEDGRWARAERVVDWLFIPQDWLVMARGEWKGARHCQRAYWKEMARLHLPEEYRMQT